MSKGSNKQRAKPAPPMKSSPASPGWSWQVVSESVQGASHIVAELLNQDARKVFVTRASVGASTDWKSVTSPKFSSGSAVIAAVADGHGGKSYIRSAKGSEIAVDVATQKLKLLMQFPPAQLTAFHRSELEYYLATPLVRHWVDRVRAHSQEEHFSDDQIADFPEIQQFPELAYGTTLLAAAANDHAVVFVQIGDGDILTVSSSREVTRPFERDPLFIGNETASLCSIDADRNVKVRLKVLDDSEDDPALILLATDGYSNCFKDDSAFAQVGADYLDMLEKDKGRSLIENSLGGWLRQASDDYSRDDITVAMIHRAAKKLGSSKQHTRSKSED